MALQSAPALRGLKMDLRNPYGLPFLPLLTQLSGLTLMGFWQPLPIVLGYSHRPLAAISNLVSLQLHSGDLKPPGPSALPPNLTRLVLDACCVGQDSRVQHVAGCRQLQELHVIAHDSHIYTHPTLVMQALAGQQLQLRKLCARLQNPGTAWGPGALRLVMEELKKDEAGSGDEDEDGEEGEEEEDWWPQLPLGADQGWPDPEGRVAVLPTDMGRLSSLQHLEFEGWWLVLSSDPCWRALGACHQLVSLPELHVSSPPPAGVTFPGVTRLEVTTSTSPGNTLDLLAAFPALKELKLDVVMQADFDDGDEVS
jgi:hypothetical protein